MVRAHVEILDSSLGDLVRAGFRPTQETMLAAKESFSKHLSMLANEVAAWITHGDRRSGRVEEAAADVICALAVLYEIRPTGSSFTADEFAAMTARLVMAGQILGVQETLLTVARLGYFDKLAKAQMNREKSQKTGRKRGQQKAAEASVWRRRAQSDWANYRGELTRSGWSKRNAAHYDRRWRAVFEAISQVDK